MQLFMAVGAIVGNEWALCGRNGARFDLFRRQRRIGMCEQPESLLIHGQMEIFIDKRQHTFRIGGQVVPDFGIPGAQQHAFKTQHGIRRIETLPEGELPQSVFFAAAAAQQRDLQGAGADWSSPDREQGLQGGKGAGVVTAERCQESKLESGGRPEGRSRINAGENRARLCIATEHRQRRPQGVRHFIGAGYSVDRLQQAGSVLKTIQGKRQHPRLFEKRNT